MTIHESGWVYGGVGSSHRRAPTASVHWSYWSPHDPSYQPDFERRRSHCPLERQHSWEGYAPKGGKTPCCCPCGNRQDTQPEQQHCSTWTNTGSSASNSKTVQCEQHRRHNPCHYTAGTTTSKVLSSSNSKLGWVCTSSVTTIKTQSW